VDSIRWWFSRRKIRSYQRQLVSRRGFLSGVPALLLAPFVPTPLPPGIIRERVAADFLKTRIGREQLALSMMNPLRTRLDYQAVSRKVFLIDQLPDSAKSVYYSHKDDT
jgi:hypothetical protein